MTDVTATDRLVSLDVFRGLTIGGMVLVNNPGTWAAVYPPLLHADWHGWTPTDMVFPFFLFIVGLAIPMALGRRVATGQTGIALYLKILRRSALLFALGLLLTAFPFYNAVKGAWVDLETLRLMGVLQRIGLCYLICALAFLWLRTKGQIVFTIILLVGYWLLMAVGGDYTAGGNLSGLIDRLVIGPNHMWAGAEHYDPEGLLSTLPAAATTMIGVLAGTWLGQKRDAHETVSGLFFFGVALMIGGWVWGLVFPINKPIWTSSYAIFMPGLGLLILAACMWLIDIHKVRWWTWPFVVFGVNALALYIGSSAMARFLYQWPWGTNADGSPQPMRSALYDSLFAPLAAPMDASLLFAVAYLGLWLGLMAILFRAKIFIKV